MRVSVRLEELQSNATWVRRLAEHLVRDGGEPDDLAQEAWVAALRSRRPSEVRLSAWMGGILRNLARMQRRGERRRTALTDMVATNAAAAPPQQADPEALLARLEIEQLLGGLVLALEEPYRSTVLLRYYEGLSAADIARRAEVPAGTVRWRLKEGLDRVRQRLDEKWGAREAWAVLLTPLARPPGSPATPSRPWMREGASLSGLKLPAVVGALLLLGAAGLSLRRMDDAAGESVAQASAAPSPGAPSFRAPPGGPPTRTGAAPPRASGRGSIGDVVTAALLGPGPAAGAGPVRRYQVPLGAAPVVGPADARITLLLLSDYECPFSARANAAIEHLLKARPRDVRVQVIQMPLSFHENALPAARAVLAAAEQGKYWEMHRLVFAGHDLAVPAAGRAPRRPAVGVADLDRHARALGLDLPRFHRDRDGASVAEKLEVDKATVESLGIRLGTPTIFVNGRRVNGAVAADELDRVVIEELRTADRILATGVPPAALYNEIFSRPTIEPRPPKLDPASLERYPGIYRLQSGSRVALERAGDQLVARWSGRPPRALVPESDTVLILNDEIRPGEVYGPVRVTMLRDGSGFQAKTPNGFVERASRTELKTLDSPSLAPAAPRPASVANDGFETGTLDAWRVDSRGAGSWFPYRSGKSSPLPTIRIRNDRFPFAMPDPPQRQFAAVSESDGVGTRLLYRDVTLDGRYRLHVTVFYRTHQRLSSPDSLDFGMSSVPDPGRNPAAANQQYRIDLVTTSAPLESLEKGHLLANVFRTRPEDPQQRDPSEVVLDLSPWRDQTVRLRVACVTNRGPLRAGLDDLRFERIAE